MSHIIPANSVSLQNITFKNNSLIEDVNLNYVPFTSNKMDDAFANCVNLTTVTNINENVSSMKRCFSLCSNFENPPAIPNSVVDATGFLQNCYKALDNYPVIPNSVEVLDDMFSLMGGSRTDVPNICYERWLSCSPNVRNRMAGMFYDWSQLVNAPVIPNGVTVINGAFFGCSRMLEAPIIPDSVVSIGSGTDEKGCFGSCHNISNVYITSSEITEARNTFYGTTATKNVYIPFNYANNEHTKTYNAFIADGYDETGTRHGVYLKDINELSSNNFTLQTSGSNVIITNYTGSDTVVVIPKYAGQDNKLVEMVYPQIFRYNTNIVSVDLRNVGGGGMNMIFYGCSNLREVYNMNYTFYGTPATYMQATFSMCTNLIEVPPIPNTILTLDGTYVQCRSLVNAPVIPNSVTNMQSAFASCSSIKETPVIPDSVQSLSSSFEYCINLTTVSNIGSGVTNMAYTFDSCSNLSGDIYIHSENITNAYCAFSQTGTEKIKNVYIPFQNNGVNTATYNAFRAAGYNELGTNENVYLKDINLI